MLQEGLGRGLLHQLYDDQRCEAIPFGPDSQSHCPREIKPNDNHQGCHLHLHSLGPTLSEVFFQCYRPNDQDGLQSVNAQWKMIKG